MLLDAGRCQVQTTENPIFSEFMVFSLFKSYVAALKAAAVWQCDEEDHVE